ncbi:LPXTG-motif cell wall anchor domain-containing protein [Geodermatophilus telluris]|uniref:LPXTG-motif cell wall anchor domain-containing protein n=1 Tax=Geodermatophilus telluris TaxID=1190417 RepID=A0A1G6S2V1_9ACTN|nr:LPXTG cell wall anchor domain-containing protein [Geodermatophilus telluris]SDD11230.1 LPXTG-motif cell wall anchor domain-containing protein [Geodermatophilus telluris]
MSSPSPLPDGPGVSRGGPAHGGTVVPAVVAAAGSTAAGAAGTHAPAAAAPARHAAWRAELRSDLRGAVVWAGLLALAGLPAGLLWLWLAPRARFEVVEGGAVPLGRPSAELLVGDDAVLVLVLAGLGLLAGGGAWAVRRRRGVAWLLATALGTTLAGVLAWQLGEGLAPGPTAAQLADVGARVTTGLDLSSLPALAVAPFCALLVYVVAALFASSDDLGRGTAETPGAPRPGPTADGVPVR